MGNRTNELPSEEEVDAVLLSVCDTDKVSPWNPPHDMATLFPHELQRFASIWMQKGRDESCELMTQVDKALLDSLHKTAEIYQKDNIELRAKLAELENQKPVGKLYLYRAPMTGGTFSLPTLRPEFDLIAEQDTYARPVPAAPKQGE